MIDEQHSLDFKREAVSLYRYSGKTIEEISTSLQIPVNTLEEWVQSSLIESNLTPNEKQTLERFQTLISSPEPSISPENINDTFLGTWMESFDEELSEEHHTEIPTVVAAPENSSCFQSPCFKEDSVVSNFGKTLGEGGMGIVHSAIQNAMGRQVAVKEVRAQVANKHTIRTLLQEAWITGFLEHPNIIPIYDISENDRGEPMILMKQVTGKDWATYLQNPELIENQAGDLLMWHLEVFDQVCRGVYYAHSRGIIHRDLKPENIMICDQGEVYVLDWGIALALDDRHSSWIPRAADARHMTGSPWYMAPEMIKGDGRELSIQTDIYLLGAILYELVTGKPPHKGSALPEILKNIPKFEPVFPADTCSSLQEIICSCLQKDPQKRPKCVNTVRSAIQTYRDYREINQVIADAELELEMMKACIEKGDQRSTIFSHYFAARFGVEQLRKHPLKTDHLSLESTFHEASLDLIEWAFKEQLLETAALTLKYLRKEEPQYAKRIQEAINQEKQKAENLRKLAITHSETIGVKTRTFVMVLVGLGWITFPLSIWLFDLEMSYRNLHIQTGTMLIWLFAIGIWARQSLSKTDLNRKTYGILLMEPLMHLVADLAAYSTGWPADTAWSLRFIVWTTMLTSYALLVETRLIWAAAIYATLTLLIFVFPENTHLFAILSNTLLLLSIHFISKPVLKNAIDARELSKDDVMFRK